MDKKKFNSENIHGYFYWYGKNPRILSAEKIHGFFLLVRPHEMNKSLLILIQLHFYRILLIFSKNTFLI